MGVANVINPMVFGGGSIELTFSDGHTEKVSGKLCTGSKDLDSSIIPLVMDRVGGSVDYCKELKTYIKTETKTYTTQQYNWGAVASGGRSYTVSNVYLPKYLPSLEELKKVKSYHIDLSRDGDWRTGGSTRNCLMWIESGG